MSLQSVSPSSIDLRSNSNNSVCPSNRNETGTISDWNSIALNEDELRQIVLNHLTHFGYPETALAFHQDISSSFSLVSNLSETSGDSTTCFSLSSTPSVVGNLVDSMEIAVEEENQLSESKIMGQQRTTISNTHAEKDEESLFILSMRSIYNRKKIIHLVLEGKIGDAIDLTEKLFPSLFTRNPDVIFRLKCQIFIELIRSRKPTEALLYAQEELSVFGLKDLKFLEQLQDLIPLLAYDNPETSPIGNLLGFEHKEESANLLNSAILDSLHLPTKPALEWMMRQLAIVQEMLSLEKQQSGS